MIDEDSFRLGIGLGFGCAAGLVQTCCDGMTDEQVARFLDNISEQPGIMETIATAALHDAKSGDSSPGSYAALIEVLSDALRRRGER